MTAESVAFLAASLTLIVAPGPDNILVLTRDRAGLVVHSTFAAVGLSALLAQSAVAYSVVKYVGAAYLIYLGLKALLGKDCFTIPQVASPVALRKIFLQGVCSNVLNLKWRSFSWLSCRSSPTRGQAPSGC